MGLPKKEVPDGLKKTIRAVLLSTNGVKIERFAKDFEQLMGCRLDNECRKLGYSDIPELITAIPDVAR